MEAAVKKISNVAAIKRFLELDDGRKVTMDEMKQLTLDDRKELGALAAKEMGMEVEG